MMISPATGTPVPAAPVATAVDTPPYFRSGRGTNTLDEERQEVFESALQLLRFPEPDADRVAACAFLFRHLDRTKQR
jgi:hypothetical protein